MESLFNTTKNLESFNKELDNEINKMKDKIKKISESKIKSSSKKKNNKQSSSSSVGKLKHKHHRNNIIDNHLIENNNSEYYNSKEENIIKNNDLNQENTNNTTEKEINNELISIQRKEINNYEADNSEIKYNTINCYGGVNIPYTIQYECNSINESKIINSKDINFIEERIKEIHPKIKNVSFNLVYRATEDGDKSFDFHNKCDKIGPNITFVKTKKGFIFGGFTFKNWEHLQRDINMDKPNLGSASRDSRAFGFSINYKKIYNNEKPNEFAIWCNQNYGPTFKNNFFQIFDDCLKKGGYCSVKNNSHFGGQSFDYEISGGESRFGVEELEVYEVQLL